MGLRDLLAASQSSFPELAVRPMSRVTTGTSACSFGTPRPWSPRLLSTMHVPFLERLSRSFRCHGACQWDFTPRGSQRTSSSANSWTQRLILRILLEVRSKVHPNRVTYLRLAKAVAIRFSRSRSTSHSASIVIPLVTCEMSLDFPLRRFLYRAWHCIVIGAYKSVLGLLAVAHALHFIV